MSVDQAELKADYFRAQERIRSHPDIRNARTVASHTPWPQSLVLRREIEVNRRRMTVEMLARWGWTVDVELYNEVLDMGTSMKRRHKRSVFEAITRVEEEVA